MQSEQVLEARDLPDGPARIRRDRVGLLPACVLALLGAGVPVFVWAPLRDQIVLPRLVGTSLITGFALVLAAVVINDTPAVSRRIALPLAATASVLILAAISTVGGADPMGSLLGEYERYQGLLPLMMYALLMLAAMLATRRPGGTTVVMWGVFVGGVLAGAYAVIQRTGLDWVQWEGVDPGRTGGAFAQPDALGVELVVVLALSAGLWAESRGWQRDLIAVGMAVMGAGLVFTQSRAAWLALGAVVIVLAAVHLRRPALRGAIASLLPILVIVGVIVTVSPGRAVLHQTVERARSSTNLADVSVSARFGLWKTALQMTADHPILGSGPDSFSTLFSRYRTPDQPGIGTANVRPESSHNFFLDQAVAIGIPGLLAWGVLIGSTLWTGLRFSRSEPQWTGALSAALVGYFVAVSFAFSEAMTGWLPWLIIGATLGIASRELPVTAMPARNIKRRVEILGRVALGACGCLLVSWACLLFLADRAAGRASDAAAEGRADEAISLAADAYRLDPLQGAYLLDRGSYEELAAAGAGEPRWRDAAGTYALFNGRFAPTAYTLVGEARARAALEPADSNHQVAEQALADAEALDPYNDAVLGAITELRAALAARSGP